MWSSCLLPAGCFFAQETLSSEYASLGMSTTGPVGFIVITVPVSIDLLTVCKLWLTQSYWRMQGFFFSTPLPEGEPKGDPKGDDGKWTHLPFLLLPPSSPIIFATEWAESQITVTIFNSSTNRQPSCHALWLSGQARESLVDMRVKSSLPRLGFKHDGWENKAKEMTGAWEMQKLHPQVVLGFP